MGSRVGIMGKRRHHNQGIWRTGGGAGAGLMRASNEVTCVSVLRKFEVCRVIGASYRIYSRLQRRSFHCAQEGLPPGSPPSLLRDLRDLRRVVVCVVESGVASLGSDGHVEPLQGVRGWLYHSSS